MQTADGQFSNSNKQSGKIYYDSINNELTSLETAQPNAILNPLSPAFPNDIEMNNEPFIPIENQDEAAPIAAGNEVW